MDTGGMYAQKSVEIGEKTTAQLHEELAELGARMIVEVLPKIADGSCTPVPQDDSLASYAPMVFKEEGVIDFTKTARQICCLVRGFNSWPTASTLYKGQVMKVHMAACGNNQAFDAAPGTIIKADKHGIQVACKGGSVLLTNIQMPGKKAMDVSAFLLGNKIEEGTVLGS